MRRPAQALRGGGIALLLAGIPGRPVVAQADTQGSGPPGTHPRARREPPSAAASPASDGSELVVQVDARSDPMTADHVRLVSDPQRARSRGAAALQDFFSEHAALSLTAGNAGLGGAPNKLNLGARGINPRFSSRTQWLWDDMPLAIAPYGRPQLTMFPLAMSWMDRIEIDLHGATASQGPHAIGGHVDLHLHDLSRGRRARVEMTVDHFGQLNADALLQLGAPRHRGAVGYMTTQGSGFRAHSRIRSHGGFARWRGRIADRHRLGLLALAYGEQSEIPGGVTPQQFAQDPRMSQRPLDRFVGVRAAGGMFWDAQLRPELHFRTRVVGGYTQRRSEVSTQTLQDAFTAPLRVNPRRFGYIQLSSQLGTRLRRIGGARGWVPSMRVGLVMTQEWARLRSEDRDPVAGQILSLRTLDDEQIQALAGFANLDLDNDAQTLHARIGVRGEVVGLSRFDHTQQQRGSHTMGALLPSVSLRYTFYPNLNLFAAWGQTFSPPQFLQIGLAQDQAQLAPERGHSAELGLFARVWRERLELQAQGFFKRIADYADVRAERLDQPGTLRAFGAESSLRARGRWRGRKGQGRRADAQVAHTWTAGRIVDGAFDRVPLPWVPRHRLRVSAGGAVERWAAFARAGLRYDGPVSTDYDPDPSEDALGSRGRLPAWTSVWVSAGLGVIEIASKLRLRTSMSVDNLFNQLQYTRTADRNAGRVMLRPRRWSLTLALEHLQRGSR